jgi:hypothetical protein
MEQVGVPPGICPGFVFPSFLPAFFPIVSAHILFQIIASKNIEIERLVNENAQLRLELQRLREAAGK